MNQGKQLIVVVATERKIAQCSHPTLSICLLNYYCLYKPVQILCTPKVKEQLCLISSKCFATYNTAVVVALVTKSVLFSFACFQTLIDSCNKSSDPFCSPPSDFITLQCIL